MVSTSAKLSPSGPEKCSRFLAKAGLGLEIGDTLLFEALLPEAKRTLRCGKDGRADFADARSALADVRERKVGHDAAGCTQLIGVIEMIDVGRVKIDGLLDAAQAELFGEEDVVLPCILRHRGHVCRPLIWSSILGLFMSGDRPPCSWTLCCRSHRSHPVIINSKDCHRTVNNRLLMSFLGVGAGTCKASGISFHGAEFCKWSMVRWRARNRTYY